MREQGKYIVGVGAANIDILCRSRNPLNMRDSNPGFIATSPGGVTRNILENAARLGLDARLISAVGDDGFAPLILRAAADAGVDVSGVLTVPGRTSSAYCAIHEPDGDMFIALSDMHILEALSGEYLLERSELISNAAAVVFDPSLPEAAIDALIDIAGQAPVFADPVSTSYAKKLLGRVGRLHTVTPNKMELEILAGMAVSTDGDLERAVKRLLDEGCKRVFTTLGGEGCFYGDSEGRFMHRRLATVEQMESATGAGDAFTAAVVYSSVHGLSPERTLELALAAGIAAIESPDTVDKAMSPAKLERIISAARSGVAP